ncbi:hypothetical protein CR513_11670, partial [Mucuna pruriens]
MGKHEEDVLRKFLPCFQNNMNQEGDMRGSTSCVQLVLIKKLWCCCDGQDPNYCKKFDFYMQFGIKGPTASRGVNKLTSLVRLLAVGQHHTSPPTRVCGICVSVEHPTDACPTL